MLDDYDRKYCIDRRFLCASAWHSVAFGMALDSALKNASAGFVALLVCNN
jgi:hypothetical protein